MQESRELRLTVLTFTNVYGYTVQKLEMKMVVSSKKKSVFWLKHAKGAVWSFKGLTVGSHVVSQ